MHVALHYLGVYGVGALKDIALTIVSTILSIILGVLAAAGRLYGPKALQIAIAWYVEIIRGLPAILQLFIIYFGFDQIGIHFSRVTQIVGASALPMLALGTISLRTGYAMAGATMVVGVLVLFILGRQSRPTVTAPTPNADSAIQERSR